MAVFRILSTGVGGWGWRRDPGSLTTVILNASGTVKLSWNFERLLSNQGHCKSGWGD